MKRIGLAAVFAVFAGSALAGDAQVEQRLEFQDTEQAGFVMDEFLAVLAALDGQAVWLELALWNAPQATNTYTIRPLQEGAGDGTVVCGQEGSIGLLDNSEHGFEINFQHPQHFHAHGSIRIGARADFPFQSIICGAEGYTDNAETPLHIRGRFVVAVDEIPTANGYYLFPARN